MGRVSFGIGSPLLGLDAVMTQQAVIERDQSTRDSHGAKRNRTWGTLATVQCFMWWGSGRIITRVGSVQQHPEATVGLDVGGLVLPAGTDVTERDRISQILDADGNEIVGKLEILAVANFVPVVEISFRRVT